MSRRRQRTPPSAEFSERPGRRGFWGLPTYVVFWFFVVAACVAFTIPALPQYQKLKRIEAELEEARRMEEALKEKSLQLQAESKALETNIEYLEARARDTLPWQLDGETVIHIGE